MGKIEKLNECPNPACDWWDFLESVTKEGGIIIGKRCPKCNAYEDIETHDKRLGY